MTTEKAFWCWITNVVVQTITIKLQLKKPTLPNSDADSRFKCTKINWNSLNITKQEKKMKSFDAIIKIHKKLIAEEADGKC